METVVPWARLTSLIAPHYPKGERGRPPIGLERMLRIYFLQQWYGLADEALEDALYDSLAMRIFAGIDLSGDVVPDATTLLKFRRLLEQHELTKATFAEVNALLTERGLLMREGSLVDATIIHAPPSTKNKNKARNPEMHQTKKGNQWYFGAKAHIGADLEKGVVHTVVSTAANVADIAVAHQLLHGAEKVADRRWLHRSGKAPRGHRCASRGRMGGGGKTAEGGAPARGPLEAGRPSVREMQSVDPGGGRTPLSRAQESLQISKGPLSGAEQDECATAHALCLGELVPSPQAPRARGVINRD
jgi:IS5 family transposase